MTGNCSEPPRTMPSPYSDNYASVEVMRQIDRLSRPMRALVHEFGAVIVTEMIADGHRNAAKLREELDAWRARRQERWLSEIPYECIRTPAQR
jgi:hypothetical protein